MRKGRRRLMGALLGCLAVSPGLAGGVPDRSGPAPGSRPGPLALAAPPRPRTPAPARTAPARPRSERAALESFLSSTERPPTASDLRGFGSRPDRLLITIAEDPALDPLLRARALGALAHTPTGEARAYLAKVLRDKSKSPEVTERLLLRRAAVATGWHGGSNAATLIGPLLDHEDPEVRVDAGVALGLSRLPEAIGLLRVRLAKEPDGRVRGHLGRQLQTLERALPVSAPPSSPAPSPTRIPPSVGGGSRSGF